MTDHQEKKLDELLDSLLSTYSDVEPRLGLESRVLANLHQSESTSNRRFWNFTWLWAGATMTAAVLLLALWIGRDHPTTPANNNAVQIKPSAPPRPQVQQSAPTGPTHAVKHEPKPHIQSHSGQNAELALNQRPPVFPTPVALSDQEKLMLAYLANTPPEQVIARLYRDDQKEAEAFWEAEPLMAQQRSGNTR
ncbi:MAG: hypothetical protein WA738_00210 [Candidatus Angelobacter sp.]